MMTSRKAEFLAGVRAELPILLGVAPFGMIYGVLALGAGLPSSVAMGMSSVVFAGSAQFLGAQLIAHAAPIPVILLSTLVINLRHVLYSASVAPYMRRLGPLWKLLLAYLLTDEAYAVSILRYRRSEHPPSPFPHWFFLGAGLTLWTGWQLSTAAGIVVGAQVPASWSLDFTLALTFIALVVPALRDRADVAAAVSAGAIALAGAGLPYKLGLVLAALTGVAVGLWVARQGAEPASATARAAGEE